jgi:hypothetical protein
VAVGEHVGLEGLFRRRQGVSSAAVVFCSLEPNRARLSPERA